MSTQKIKRMIRNNPAVVEIGYTGGGHLKIRLSNGRFVIAAASPSCHNFVAKINRQIQIELQR